ncbi:LysR family transcriptional regulator [Bacillus aquiflavi]|uniref:LysR family transcriptional regulator n=1 Tax=Bacillus aquiflavi TaxID=2672567 RepID=A0A6B3VYV8_9BACI|nr:LysR family transcriptional regulator [Bacillus aquiflavi]MBA4536586.1 LysR family transcriptional regulator [Bacillus aquiflavi]NEY80953.1 LysR family transcriptional regulator [Bacillus aquiflavi]UAC49667.1 LysR family transcriptional regulator [Bacillus aquiflavi]
MDVKAIKSFLTIIKCRSFQRAAEKLNYAQSTITTHIKNLEVDLGITLIERGRELKLTEAGMLLHEKGDFLLKELDSL